MPNALPWNSPTGRMTRPVTERFLLSVVPGSAIPDTAHAGDAGMDLRAREDAVVPARGRTLVPTGVRLSLPEDCVAYVCSRSGLALNHGVAVLNAPGVVDSGYRGEVGVILFNTADSDYRVRRGDKVAQMVIQRVVLPEWEVVAELDATDRGTGGFGSSGTA